LVPKAKVAVAPAALVAPVAIVGSPAPVPRARSRAAGISVGARKGSNVPASGARRSNTPHAASRSSSSSSPSRIHSLGGGGGRTTALLAYLKRRNENLCIRFDADGVSNC
jgi:hypothetical protein